MYRYVCPKCLRTFLSDDYQEDRICWRCGEGTEVIPKDEDKLNPGYICNTCALHHGAVWPKGHAATFHSGICDICKKESAVCHTSDWNWPLENKNLQEDREI